jgi:hypothetical protein
MPASFSATRIASRDGSSAGSMSPRRAARDAGAADGGVLATADTHLVRGAGRDSDAAGELREEVVFFDKN